MSKVNTQYLSILFLLLIPHLFSCAQSNIQKSTEERPVSFPGAEGFGKYAVGGRGAKVFIVTNLNDNGPGSFREAAEHKSPRTIVFNIAGTIHLESKLSIRADVTIAGQSAPGDGICLADYPVNFIGDNIIVRYLRFRMGDKNQKGGMVDGNGSDDAFGGVRRKNIIIDHCSMSWSTDEVFSVYAGDSTTLQWNIISEPLNYSYHFEKGDKDFEHHGFGGIWGGKHLTAHHNLFAHCNNRNPRFDGIRNAAEENVDYRNNVIYNWGANNIYAGEGGSYNIVNNYFKYGPSTHNPVKYRIVNPGMRDKPFIPFGKFYVAGNYVDGSPEVTSDNYLGVHMGSGALTGDKEKTVLRQAIQSVKIPIQPANLAYESVLRSAGASHSRDTLDIRIINDVRNRTGRFIDVQGGYPHGTEYSLTVNAWPVLRAGEPIIDSDLDGIADEWEKMNGLNPSSKEDGNQVSLHKFYTNLEVYLNGLIKD